MIPWRLKDGTPILGAERGDWSNTGHMISSLSRSLLHSLTLLQHSSSPSPSLSHSLLPSHSLSLSLCIFLFIFTALFEVVITLHVSFDALMNRLFACDALENGNYDSLSLSPTFLCTLSPVALLPRPHFHLLLFSSPRPIILFFLFVFFLLQIIVSLKYCLPRDLCLRLVFPLSPTHSFFLYISLSSLFLTLLLYILFIILFAQMLSQVPHCYGCRFVRVVFVFLTVSDPCKKMCKMSHHVYHCMCESWSWSVASDGQTALIRRKEKNSSLIFTTFQSNT